MSLRKKRGEIQRLLEAFECEAAKFHDLQISTYLVSQDGVQPQRKFSSPNHTIMLWQYYGRIQPHHDAHRLLNDLEDSDLQWGIRGPSLSSFAVLEGGTCDLFVRMAKRAGNLFTKKEALVIKSRVLKQIFHSERLDEQSGKPTGVTNDNPLAIWINYLLYYLSLTHPGREHSQRIDPDPFTLSLLALERLMTDPVIKRVDQSFSKITEIKFRVAMSFPGEKRTYVSKVVEALRPKLGKDTIFYDYDYQSQLARPNLDTLLQEIYRSNSELVVIFLCSEYAQKQWCGLEWRAIRDIIKSREDDRVMFIRFDNTQIDGVLSIDGYIDASAFDEPEIAKFILERLAVLSGETVL